MPAPYSKKMKYNVDSDFFFNNPKAVKDMEEYCDVTPVDVMGGFVPQDKSIENLKKTQDAIQERFGLKVGGEDK